MAALIHRCFVCGAITLYLVNVFCSLLTAFFFIKQSRLRWLLLGITLVSLSFSMVLCAQTARATREQEERPAREPLRAQTLRRA